MKTAVIYARYSSDRQTEQSIEGQLRVCNDYAERNDILIIDTYIDRAMTGTNDNRANFQRLMKDSAKQAWDIVLVYKLDRFSRNKYEMAMHKKTLRDNGIKLVSAMENIPDTPEGIILESLLEGMAEYYSAELSQKVKRGMNESRHKGQYTGGLIIYGYKVENKKVLIDEEQAKILRYMYEQYASGVYVKDIIAELTEKGIYYRGKPFKRTTVYNLLRNEKYAGILRHGDEVFTNIYPQIVPDEIYNIVREKIESNHYGKHDSTVKYLLKNKVHCGYCGHTIASDSGTAKSGEIKRYYKCTNRKHNAACRKTPIRKDVLEQLVINTTFKIFASDENIIMLADKVLAEHKRRRNDDSVLNLLVKERNNVQKAIDNLLKCMEQGIVSNSTKKRIDELEHNLEELNEKILIEKSKTKIQLSREEIIKYLKTTMKKTPEQIIKYLVKDIVLYDDKIEIYYNYTDPKRSPDDESQGFSFYTDIFETVIDEHKFKGKPYTLKLQITAFFI